MTPAIKTSDSSAGQGATIAFLGDPGAYAHCVSAVERIETHAAIVFIAGPRAFKIKRAVRLPYLDFSRLETRREVLEHELALNRETAPELYLDVCAIRRSEDGTLAFDGDGDVVEWVLVMKAFSQSQLFDKLAKAGSLDDAQMMALAERIARAHDTARVDKGINPIAAFASVIDHISETLLLPQSPLDKQQIAETVSALRSTLMSVAPLLETRAQQGFVRRCHGDLHLGNIVLINGVPTLFDALEFDDRLATIDVLYDLAFLIMDLWHRGLRQHANRLLNHYLLCRPDNNNLDGLSLLPLFLALRASVRAMVAIHRKTHLTRDAVSRADTEIKAYFELAGKLISPIPPRLVAIGGLSGTGKSTLGAALAPDIGSVPGAIHLRSDVERKRLFDVAATTRLPETSYTKDITKRIYDMLHDKARRVLAAGHSTIVDAVFSDSIERAAIATCADQAHLQFDGLWLAADPRVLITRVDQRRNDASDADARIVRQQLSYDIGKIEWHEIDADCTPEKTYQRAKSALRITDSRGLST